MILAAALAFLAFYVWFFWLRGFFGRSAPPDDFDGDMAMSFADGAKRTAVTDRSTGKSPGQGRGTFGKR